jgi:hypothetical protein
MVLAQDCWDGGFLVYQAIFMEVDTGNSGFPVFQDVFSRNRIRAIMVS